MAPITARKLKAAAASTSLEGLDLPALRAVARVRMAAVPEQRRQVAAWAFISQALKAYVVACGDRLGIHPTMSPLTLAVAYDLDDGMSSAADAVGQAAAALPIEQASFHISNVYTALLPQGMRSELGIYYTPPALTARLLDMAEEAGIDWSTARALDPACGGGAFLLPVALRIRETLKHLQPAKIVDAVGSRLRGFEIDPFAAWLTQVWLEIAFADLTKAAGRTLPTVVSVCNALDQIPKGRRFDLTVGNPPYGRMVLSPEQRERYKRGLYGHANLYGVFTDLALRWTKPKGTIAYVTPTSFLAGEYFKALRKVIAKDAPPIAIDFITARRGVFDDVLQETALTTYRRSGRRRTAAVHYVDVATETKAKLTAAGSFRIPRKAEAPWIAPREPGQRKIVSAMARMTGRLADWGYEVSTGPLVWNRHKEQMMPAPAPGAHPLVWAESVTADGRFVFRAERRNHAPYFQIRAGDEWLRVSEPCVLLQRTTAKEQSRRLIAAELPEAFITEHGGVVVENHLNMVRAMVPTPKVPPAVVAAALNSTTVDQAFRCISGSVAVSAFELEALPLPSAAWMLKNAPLLKRKNGVKLFEAALRRRYLRG